MPTIVRSLCKVHPLEVAVKNAGVPVTGLTPTLEIRQMSTGKYFDFSAVGLPYFVSSGGSQTMVLPESLVIPGLYRYEFNSTGKGLVTGDELTFLAKNSTPANRKFYETEHVVFESDIPALLDRTSLIWKIEKNRWKLDRVANTMTFYDDDQVTPLLVFDMKDMNAVPSVFSIFERVPQ